jgi:hypothetical protein
MLVLAHNHQQQRQSPHNTVLVDIMVPVARAAVAAATVTTIILGMLGVPAVSKVVHRSPSSTAGGSFSLRMAFWRHWPSLSSFLSAVSSFALGRSVVHGSSTACSRSSRTWYTQRRSALVSGWPSRLLLRLAYSTNTILLSASSCLRRCSSSPSWATYTI